MNQLSIVIEDISLVIDCYDKIKIYRADAEAGPWTTELTDENTRIDIIPETLIYYYQDDEGLSTHWYKTSYYDSITTDESELSSARQGGTEVEKIGYTFGNYSPPSDEWGKVLTGDDIRFTYLWGIDLTASDVIKSNVEDYQLEWCAKEALEAWEKELNIDILKKIYKVDPADTLNRSRYWREGVDYTDEEDWYDFNHARWTNYGFVQLRHKPLISIQTAEMYDMLGNKILDVLDWIRMHKKAGQLNIYPKGTYSIGKAFAGSGALAAWPGMYSRNFPHGWKIEYTTGQPNSDFVPSGLRDIIGMYAAIIALAWIGDGLMAGFSSSSVSLDNLSESFSSTQSATSAYFGARIKSYLDQIKEFRKRGKLKYSNIPVGFIG